MGELVSFWKAGKGIKLERGSVAVHTFSRVSTNSKVSMASMVSMVSRVSMVSVVWFPWFPWF